METQKVKEGQVFYQGQDITKMQLWELIDALAQVIGESGMGRASMKSG
jgi:hypothetical protein